MGALGGRTVGVLVAWVSWDYERFSPPPPPPRASAAVRMPAAVRRPACHSRRFKGERPIGAATG